MRKRNYAFFFEPRLGKSKAALDYIGILALKGEVRKVLILAPSIALDVWRREIDKHFPYWYDAEDFEYTWHSKTKIFAGNPPEVKFFLAGREETFRASRPHIKLERPKQQELERWNPDAIILDESHQYKRPGSRGAQDAWRLVRRLRKHRRRGPYVLLLTGTPNPKGWRDLFAQFRIMDETLLGTSASDFDEEHVVRGVGRRRWTIIRYRNVKKLKRVVRENSTTCTAKQAGLEGKLFWQVLPVQLPPKVRALYDEMAEELIVETKRGTVSAANQGVLRLRLLQITSGFVTSSLDGHGTEKLHDAKTRALRAYASNLFDQGESVVVYCRFTAEVDAAVEELRRVGYRVGVLDGRTPRRDRGKVVQGFQSGRTKALVAQYQAGSMAIELTAAAEVVFTSLPDGWVDFFQALNRVRGPNQDRPVRVSALVATGTVDRRVLYSLRRKQDWHTELMRDPKGFLHGVIQ